MSDPGASAPLVYYKWKEISDLPGDLESFRDRELEALCEVWTRDLKTIGDEDRVRAFNTELAREWAIETGIIEGAYTLDRGTTRILIERGIDSAYISHRATDRDPELVARMIQAHFEVLEGLFAFVKGERGLTPGYIKELHAALLRHVQTVVVFDQFDRSFETSLEKGVYKRLPNNPRRPDGTLHEYCPPEHVASEMDRLVGLHGEHEQRGVPPLVEAAWLHHAFTQIHPFQDGNGRVARALASLVLIKSGFLPLVVSRDGREQYIRALELADTGDLGHLIRLFAQTEKRELTRAISRAADTKPAESVEEALATTKDMLVGPGRIIPAEYLRAKETANGLLNQSVNRLNAISISLANDITRVNSAYKFEVETLAGPPGGEKIASEIRLVAEKLRYEPNTSDFQHSALIRLTAHEAVSRVVISFHGVGPAFRGLLVSVAYFQTGDAPPVPVCDDIFRISYQESIADSQKRFSPWLEQVLIEGLAAWRRTLA